MFLSLGQRMLNEQIEASTAAKERLGEIDGKRLAVVVAGTDFRIVAEAADGRLRLSLSPDAGCDVELCGGLIDLLKLSRNPGLSDLRDADCTLSGDIGVAESFGDLLRLAMPEPEAVLADWVGDIPAHAVGQAARGLVGWGKRAQSAFEQNLAEYLQEEKPALVPPALARRFIREVDRIRDDVERAERRIATIEQQMNREKAD